MNIAEKNKSILKWVQSNQQLRDIETKDGSNVTFSDNVRVKKFKKNQKPTKVQKKNSVVVGRSHNLSLFSLIFD